ncbi:S9 family peptidase [Apilactobacillus apisilvae]|uniref:S9 family peptidase n=1 Tax=Apilactobacillus apisilvae TaxID=2923364 RepID=A0ABY4PFA3_9LACO|nr:S9 family peptidase [Apilactobacillus apisilvae]UQS84446.1 S9 family peptidase [Apilactobacillus apisilvae]
MKKINDGDIYDLYSLTQLNSDKFFVKNGIDKFENSYTAKIYHLDNHLNSTPITDESFSLSPIKINDELYYLNKINGNMQLVRRSLTNHDKKILTSNGNVSDLLSSKNKQKLFFKVTRTKVEPKFEAKKFPQVRYINCLDNRNDGFGWKDHQTVYILYEMDVATGDFQILKTTKHNFNILDINQDGTSLMFSQNIYSLNKSISRVYKLNLVSMKENLITPTDGNFNEAIFAPDNNNALLVGNNNEYGSGTVFDLYVYNFIDEKMNNLTSCIDDIEVSYNGGLATDFVQNRSNKGVKWINNDYYLFHATSHGRSQIYLGFKDDIKKIYDDETEIYDFSILNENQLLLSVSSQSSPNKLLLFNIKEDKQQLVYNPNKLYEQKHDFVLPKSFSTISEDKKFNIHGWCLFPETNKTKVPVILYIHGGPHETYGDSFFYEFQYLASHGFAVLFMNPRGSSSYGQTFEKASMGRVGKEDYSDILTGLNYSMKKFDNLDKDNIFIAGGSYGGFMASWIISHTDKFKAAIVQRPIVDWHSFYGTSDIGVRFSRNELGADMDDEGVNFYWDASPLKYAKNIKTPTRIQHGEWDMRCPVNQSEALFQAIKRNDIEADYIRYPQSFHGFSRNGLPNLRVQRINDIYNWFNNHVN